MNTRKVFTDLWLQVYVTIIAMKEVEHLMETNKTLSIHIIHRQSHRYRGEET